MKNYCPKIKGYLDDLAAKKPSPGGGSAVALAGCMGIGLIEMAMQYSLEENRTVIADLSQLRKKIFPAIDQDAKLFAAIMKAKPQNRLPFVKKSEELVILVGLSAIRAAQSAKKYEPEIKRNILSDFNLGFDLLKVCLKGCLLNLEGNGMMFGKGSTFINTFKKALIQWPNC
jgi:formiminotetrahydrofolate cyclodeaminase